MLNSFFLSLFEGQNALQQEGVVLGGELIELLQEGHLQEPQVHQDLQEVVVVVEVILHPFLLLAGIVSDAADILLPFQDQLDHVERQLGEVVEAVREQLKPGLAHLAFVGFLDQFELVPLGTILFPLIFALLVEHPLLGGVEVLVDVLRGEVSKLFFEVAEAGLSGVDAFEERVVDVFLVADEGLFFADGGLYVLEIAGDEELEEVVAVKVGDIAIVPENFKFLQLLVQVDIVPQDTDVHLL